MSYAIVYSSRTGNTALLAQALKEALPQGSASIAARPMPKPWPPKPSMWGSGPTKALAMPILPSFSKA